MKQSILRWAAGVAALIVTISLARVMPFAQIEWQNPWQVIVFVPALAVINAIIGPFLKLLALPINCLTFGLFSFIVNSLLFWLAGVVTAMSMNAAGALFGSVMYAFLSTVICWPIKEI